MTYAKAVASDPASRTSVTKQMTKGWSSLFGKSVTLHNPNEE